MKNWEIRSRSRFCSSCESPFEIGEVYHTLLDLNGDEPERRDYCIRCWKEEDPGPESRGGDRSAYWQAHFKRITALVEKKEAVQKDVIERLLARYIRSEDKAHINLCYILALLEERKKVLVPQDKIIDKEGNKIIVYEQRKTGETYLIRDPHLTLMEVESVQAQVKELIDREKLADSSPSEEENDLADSGEETGL
jgi:hypothetical protein